MKGNHVFTILVQRRVTSVNLVCFKRALDAKCLVWVVKLNYVFINIIAFVSIVNKDWNASISYVLILRRLSTDVLVKVRVIRANMRLGIVKFVQLMWDSFKPSSS